MRRVCSWCDRRLPDKPPFEDNTVTHSQCRSCHEAEMAALAEMEGRIRDNASRTAIDGGPAPGDAGRDSESGL
jgi:hypothetical protein